MARSGSINYNIIINLGNSINQINNLNQSFNSLLTSGMALAGIGSALKSAITDPLMEAVKQGLAFNEMMDDARISFTAFLGDAQASADLVSELKGFADVTPFQMKHMTQSAKTLLGFGVEADVVMTKITQLGDISAGNADRFERLSLSFSQVASMGRLQGRELREMAIAGFNPLSIISEKTGKSMTELKTIMEAGGISYELLSATMAHATAKGGMFYNLMEEKSKTFEGRMSTLRDVIATTFGAFTKPLYDALANSILPKFTNFLKGLSVWFINASDGAKTLVMSLGAFLIIAPGVLVAVGAITAMVKLAGGAVFGWTTLILAIIAVLTVLTVKTEWMPRVWETAWNVYATIVNKITETMKNFSYTIGNALTSIEKGWIQFWGNLKETVFAMTLVIGGKIENWIKDFKSNFSWLTASLAELKENPFGNPITFAKRVQERMPNYGYDFKSEQEALDVLNEKFMTFDPLGDPGGKRMQARYKAAEDYLKTIEPETIAGVKKKYAVLFDEMKKATIDSLSGVDNGGFFNEAGKYLEGAALPMFDELKSKLKGFGDLGALFDPKKYEEKLKDLNKLLQEGMGGMQQETINKINSSVKSMISEMISDIKKLTDTWGIFDKATLNTSISMARLTRNLENQALVMKRWSDALLKIKSMAGAEGAGYVQALYEAGPKYYRTVKALSEDPLALSKAIKSYSQIQGTSEYTAVQMAGYKREEEKRVNQFVFNITGNKIQDDDDIKNFLDKAMLYLKTKGGFSF